MVMLLDALDLKLAKEPRYLNIRLTVHVSNARRYQASRF